MEVEKKHFDAFFESWEMRSSDKGTLALPNNLIVIVPRMLGSWTTIFACAWQCMSLAVLCIPLWCLLGGTSPPGSYTQTMPPRSATSGLPPILPPLLQQTVLNQDQPYVSSQEELVVFIF